MITTVTLNPMLDKTVHVDTIRRGAIQRASKIGMVVGGKGVNVSRQLKHLGIESISTGFAGGEVGTMIERLLDEEGIVHQFVRVAGMSREGITYREDDGTATAVFEPPHMVTRLEANRLVEHVGSRSSSGDWVVCSGSSPSPEADNAFARIVRAARNRSVNTFIDSYGIVCRNALESVPTIFKLNKQEYEETFGKKLSQAASYHGAFDEVLARGVSSFIITDGPGTVYAATIESRWKITPPTVSSVNPTGSGDSMVAGILYGYARGWDTKKAIRFGVAAGASNAQHWEVATSPLEEILSLETKVKIEDI
jgi:tagatose 6-phosphate kinase